MTPGDIADVIAFLRTLPAVPGRPPAHQLPFPLSVRRTVGLWKVSYFDNASLRPDPAQSAQWNLGYYLVEGPGHCGECHTPRNLLGAMKPNLHLAGAPVPDGKGGNAPNLTRVLVDWTNADIVEALSSGFTPEGDVLGGAMTGVVRNLAQLPKSDLEAIAVYVKSLPPLGAPAVSKP
jgi:mono/diheme cytochrome c family protein